MTSSTEDAQHPFSFSRRVEFCETDAAGIAHFSAFLCYMEQAEHALWRHLGHSVMLELETGGHLSWPRVHVECDYMGIAQFEDELDIAVRVLKMGDKSITYGFRFTCQERLIAEGQTVAVCCVVDGADLQSVSIPTALRDQLSQFLSPAANPEN